MDLLWEFGLIDRIPELRLDALFFVLSPSCAYCRTASVPKEVNGIPTLSCVGQFGEISADVASRI